MSTTLVTQKPPQAPPVDANPFPELRIKVADIHPSKTNPRKLFPADDLAGLADSIRKHGVIQALLLRPSVEKKGAFEIVAGERRWRAAKEAGVVDVPAMVRDLSDEEVLEIQIVENLQRRDLSPLEEAEGYNVLLKARYTYEQIADRIGRSRQYVFDRCGLLKLVQGATELLRAGRIDVGHAILLARLSPEDQVRTIREPEGGFDERHSGLWQRQRAMPLSSLAVEQGERDEGDVLKPVSVRELAAWIQDHVRLKPLAPENAELFPQVADALRAAGLPEPGRRALKVIEISLRHQLPDDAKSAETRTYGPMSWTRADGQAGSRECASSVLGIVVAGPGQGEAFRVCIDKKRCQVHYKEEIAAAGKREAALAKSGATGAERAALERAQRAEIEANEKAIRERFARALPAIQQALAEKVRSVPVARLQSTVTGGLGWSERNGLALAAKLLEPGKTIEGWLRTVALGVVLAPTTDHYVNERSLRDVAKAYGLDIPKLVDSANASDADTKAAAKAKKPAKKTAAKSAKKG